MPVVISIDCHLPHGVEDGLENLARILSRVRRCVRLGATRKWKIFKTQMMEVVDQLRPADDERPILRKSGKISIAALFLVMICF